MGGSMQMIDGGSSKKGFYVSKFAAAVFGIVIVLLMVAEGLLIGLVARPTCNTVSSPDPTTTTPPKTSDPTTTTPPKTSDPTTTPTTATTTATTATTTTQAPGIWDNDRLPLNLIPEHYWVDLRAVFDEFPTPITNMFYGFSSVRYRCDVSTDYLILHTYQINYTADFTITDNDTGAAINIVDSFFHPENQYLIVQTESPCVAGKKYIFSAPAYHGILGNDLEGFYRSTYVNEFGDQRIIAVTQMETTGARHAFPSFDEPAMKATFDITLRNRVDDGYIAISNMPVLRYEPETFKGQSWNATVFQTTNIMPTYLLAFVVCDFTYEPGYTADGTPTLIYARKEAIDNGEGVYAAWATPNILDHLAGVYNIPYDWPKSDQLSAPDFAAGAMENWGLVLYRESLLLVEDNVTTVRSKWSVTSVIAHELAHQWFGNLVSCAWWNEIWLNEGFATYVSYIGVDGVQPTWHVDEMFILDELQGALSVDSRSSSHPLVHPEGYFSTISYSKGGSVIRMIEDFLGEPTFTTALTNYLLEFQYGNAEHGDLFKNWIDQASADGLTFPYDLEMIFESWTLQMGYPLITVREGATPNTFELSQEYFLVDPEDSPVSTPGSEEYGYRWYVPFTYKTESDISTTNKQTIWMGPEDPITTITASAGDTYIVGNLQAKGFYRIHYDLPLWNRIVAKLDSPSFTDISPQTRAQLIDDAFNLVRADKMDVGDALKVTNYLYRDTDYIPWESFTDEMVYFGDMLSGSPINTDFRRKMVELVEPSLYSYYGWDDSDTSDEQFMARMARDEAITFACNYGSQDCITNATMRFESWKKTPPAPGTAFIPSLTTVYRTDVYCNGIREGTIDDWDFVFDQISKVTNYDYQNSLRWALSCSKDPWVLHRYLEYALDDSKIPPSEISRTFSYVAGKESGKYEAMSFLYNNWDEVVAAGTIGAATNLIDAAVDLFSTEFDISLLESMKVVAPPSYAGTLNSYIDIVQENILWRSNHEAAIGVWLGSTVSVAPPTPRKRMYVREKLPNFNFAFRKKYRFSKPY